MMVLENELLVDRSEEVFDHWMYDADVEDSEP